VFGVIKNTCWGNILIKQSIIINIPDNIDAPLWRYISIDRLILLLENSALYFCRADLFSDPLEGIQSGPTIAYRPVFFEGATDHWLSETMPMFDSRERKCLYVNCWHNNYHESEFMWKEYSARVAIKSSLKRIKSSILETGREFLVSPVNYIDHNKDFISDANSFYRFFCKNVSYKDEREVRFAVIQNYEHLGDEDFDTLTFDNGIFIPIDYSRLIEKIIMYPSIQSDEHNRIYDLLKTYNIQNKLFPSMLTEK